MRRRISFMASGRFDQASNCRHDTSELAYLPCQLFAAGGGHTVVTGAAVVLRLFPLRFYPSLEEHSLQGWIERAFLHLQHLLGNLLNVLRDAIAVHRSDPGK